MSNSLLEGTFDLEPCCLFGSADYLKFHVLFSKCQIHWQIVNCNTWFDMVHLIQVLVYNKVKVKHRRSGIWFYCFSENYIVITRVLCNNNEHQPPMPNTYVMLHFFRMQTLTNQHNVIPYSVSSLWQNFASNYCQD